MWHLNIPLSYIFYDQQAEQIAMTCIVLRGDSMAGMREDRDHVQK